MEKHEIIEMLKTVDDPELGINIVDLGLIYDITMINHNNVMITMTLTTPGCPLHDSIHAGVINAVSLHEDIDDVKVDIVWEPQWTPEMMSKEAKEHLWS